jgi:hypothetical protein
MPPTSFLNQASCAFVYPLFIRLQFTCDVLYFTQCLSTKNLYFSPITTVWTKELVFLQLVKSGALQVVAAKLKEALQMSKRQVKLRKFDRAPKVLALLTCYWFVIFT